MNDELNKIMRTHKWWRDPLLLHKARRLMIALGYPPLRRIFKAGCGGCPYRKQFYGFFGKD